MICEKRYIGRRDVAAQNDLRYRVVRKGVQTNFLSRFTQLHSTCFRGEGTKHNCAQMVQHKTSNYSSVCNGSGSDSITDGGRVAADNRSAAYDK